MRTEVVSERHHELGGALRDVILGLIGEADPGDGSEVLGEAKRAQLEVGAQGWSGVLARAGDRPIGYGHVRWGRPDAVPRATAELVVVPGRHDREDVARRLVDEVRRMVAETGGGTLYVWAHGVADPLQALPAAAGLSVQRTLAVMERPLREPPEVGEPPQGVALRRYRPGADDPELLRVNNAAFAGHAEQGGWDAGTLVDRTRRPWFDPDDVILAWRGDRLLGFHWTKIHPGEPPVGEVYVLGVGPDARGTGLGGLLLRAGLAHLHARDCRHALLYVDQANGGAVRLYRAAGFQTRHHEVCYEDTVPSS